MNKQHNDFQLTNDSNETIPYRHLCILMIKNNFQVICLQHSCKSVNRNIILWIFCKNEYYHPKRISHSSREDHLKEQRFTVCTSFDDSRIHANHRITSNSNSGKTIISKTNYFSLNPETFPSINTFSVTWICQDEEFANISKA